MHNDGMAEGFTQTLHGLIRKRAECGGAIDTLHAQLELRMAEMHTLDSAIRVFAPEIDLETMPVRRVTPANASFRGEMSRFFLDALRRSPDGLTTAELSTAVMRARRLNTADLVLARATLRRTGNSLKGLRAKGYITSTKATAGGMLRWSLGDKAGEPVGGWRNGSG
jgi:hypothetical protein